MLYINDSLQLENWAYNYLKQRKWQSREIISHLQMSINPGGWVGIFLRNDGPHQNPWEDSDGVSYHLPDYHSPFRDQTVAAV